MVQFLEELIKNITSEGVIEERHGSINPPIGSLRSPFFTQSTQSGKERRVFVSPLALQAEEIESREVLKNPLRPLHLCELCVIKDVSEANINTTLIF